MTGWIEAPEQRRKPPANGNSPSLASPRQSSTLQPMLVSFGGLNAFPDRQRTMAQRGEPSRVLARQKGGQNFGCFSIREPRAHLGGEFQQLRCRAIRAYVRDRGKAETHPGVAPLADEQTRNPQRYRAKNGEQSAFSVILERELTATIWTSTAVPDP